MKKQRLTPQEKKKNRYDKDYVLNVEYPHSFRNSWKDGMREENRHYRRKVKQKFHDLENCEDEINFVSLRKKKQMYWEIWTVRERVKTQLDQRRKRQAWGYFRQPYNSEIHRQYFVIFLESITESDSVHACRVAAEMEYCLYPPSPKDGNYWYNSWRYKWLQYFFKDEPGWELRLQEWVNSILHGQQ